MKFLVTSIKYLKYFVDLLKTRKISYNQICEENKSNFLINFFILKIFYFIFFFFLQKKYEWSGTSKVYTNSETIRVHSKKNDRSAPPKTKKKNQKRGVHQKRLFFQCTQAAKVSIAQVHPKSGVLGAQIITKVHSFFSWWRIKLEF